MREVDLDGAVVVRPRGARAVLALAHGAGAGMRHPFLRELAFALAEHKIATLRWEFPYMAEGRARPDRPPVAEAAVQRMWSALGAQVPKLPRFAGGKSFGGRMTSRAHAAQPLAGCAGLIFVGFPLHPPEKPGMARPANAGRAASPEAMRRSASPATAGRAASPEAMRRSARPATAGRAASPEAMRRSIERAEHLAQASGPMLFLQGTRDELAELALLRPVVAGLGGRAALHVIDGADHGFDVLVRSGRTHDDVMAELAATIETWIARILDS